MLAIRWHGSCPRRLALQRCHHTATPFQLWDSLSQSLQEIPLQCPQTNKTLAWYTCGPTTYAAMHLGHARTYVWFDMMRRVLEQRAWAQGVPPPLFVMNVTDIDDKILRAAKSNNTNQSPRSVARQAEANFFQDMDRLGCLRPHIVPRVTEFVTSDIVPYIERLVQHGMAYEGADGVYFDVQALEANVGEYGKLAGNRGNDDDNCNDEDTENVVKRDRRDFALWKLRKEGEDVYWASPWGEGRPGWHIECSAMIEAVQKQFHNTHKFLVHAGGVDLKFPHHTNEIAQAEAYHGCDGCDHHHPWIPHWVHTGHLMVQQEKMSKSLQNFLTVDELWFDCDEASSSELVSPADDFRWWCLTGGPYGQRQEYSRSKILSARQNREKILRFLLDGEDWVDRCHEKMMESFEKSVRRWSDQDHNLFTTVNSAASEAHQALANNMQGTQYAKKLNQVAEAGNAYIREHQPSETANVEPIRAALKQTRDLLALVGFSSLTVNAGSKKVSSTKDLSDGTASYVVGGERAILEALVEFRTLVRVAALEDLKAKKGTENMKAIMKGCDKLRDRLPEMGVEVMDTKQEQGAQWRFCVPKGRTQE